VSHLNPIVETALLEFKQAQEAENQWRSKALDDGKFALLSEQWPQEVRTARQMENRPCLTINRTLQFIRQITNDARMNRPSVKVIPVDDSDVEVAEVYEGMVRNIQVRSNADVAYDTACLHQVTQGIGYFRVITDYVDEASFDQEILIEQVKNPFSVYFDPSAKKVDYSDARFAFVVEDLLHDDFKRLYPNAKTTSSIFTDGDGDSTPDWMDGKVVRVAEYFCVEEKASKLYLLEDGTTLTAEEKKAAEEAGFVLPIKAEREVTNRKVMWRKITCCEVLEEREWAGKFIPIIPVIGEDVTIDGKRDLMGIVRHLKDAQRQYNYWTTASTEAIALAPKAPFLVAEGQIEGYEQVWARANTENLSYLPYKPSSIDGSVVPMPQRMQAEPPVQAMMMATRQASDDMKATTGIFDASLGNRSNETSGKAILARQKVGDIANFHFIDNLSRAIRHLGVILIDLIPRIYDAPRVVRIIGEDDSEKVVKVNQPPTEGAVEKIYDLTTGKYDVVVDVGPSYNTKRQESAEQFIALLQSLPIIGQAAPDLAVKMMDMPLADELAERLKKTLPPELQDLDEENGKAPVPPQVKAMLDKSQAMIDQLTQALNAAQDEIQTKQQELDSRERIAEANNETKLVIEAMKQNHAAALQLMQAEIQSIQGKLGSPSEGSVDNSVNAPDYSNNATVSPLSDGSERMI
jgi:hypothetical protein